MPNNLNSETMQKRILTIEKNPLNQRLIQRQLTGMGFEVLEARDSQSGIELAIEEKPDLILLAIYSSDGDGLKIRQQLKNHTHTAAIPIIALTTALSIRGREDMLQSGYDDCLPKPLERHHLQALLQRMLLNPSQ
ncbi:response regulator [Anaerolineales bacterium]